VTRVSGALLEGVTLVSALGEEDADSATAMLVGEYWNEGTNPARIRAALLGSSVWVGARDRSGALVGMARAISDRARRAWIYDVIIAPAWRGCGLGRAIMELVLDHPAVRDVETVLLNTRDAERFYEGLGFRTRFVRGEGDARSAEMILDRRHAREG
jgi:ribosomal protein S18 acetylase RimI-like enzyme